MSPLRQLKLQRGPWRHSERFTQVHVAHEWNLTPSEFFALDPLNQAYMAQYTLSIDKMLQYERDKSERRLALQRHRSGRGAKGKGQ